MRRILIQLRQRPEARLRVLDHEGDLIADAARLGPRREPDQDEAEAGPERVINARFSDRASSAGSET